MIAETHAPRLALIGCGAWGRNIARTLHRLRALQLICDLSEEARSVAAHVAPGVAFSRTIQDAWRKDIDGVVIATPAATHGALTEEALRASKDVLVEKPMALNFNEAAALAELAISKGRILMVGHVLEYHPAMVEIRQLIDAGRVGRLQYIYANRLNLGKIRREENVLWSFAPHDIAVVLRLVGRLPSHVISCGATLLQADIADVSTTHLQFTNGVCAHIAVSWLHPFKEQRLVVVGDAGMLTFDDGQKRLTLTSCRVNLSHTMVPQVTQTANITFAQDEPLRCEMQAFLAAIASRQTPLTDAQSGLATLKVLEAAQQSLATAGMRISID